MPTQAEIDAALETVSQPQTDSAYHYAAMEMLAYEYRKLIDPTPIAPELLEAEGFTVNEDGIFTCGGVKICRNFREGEWLIQFGSLACVCLLSRKTMGGVRLAMMQARGSK